MSISRGAANPCTRARERLWLAVVAAAFLAGALADRGVAQIPDTFTNLEVFPDDVSRSELVGVMRGFSFALGVRCNYCHVGDDPNDLTGYDFASDEKEPKRIAREMMRIRRDVNERILTATARERPVEVGCATCHRGIARPVALSDEILDVVREEGAEAAERRYRELREQYYGRAAYDFGQGPLNTVTETLTREGDLDAALAMIALNIEHHPEEPYPLALQAQTRLAAGDREGAIRSIEAAIALDPENEFYRAQLERLRREPS
ncbi:MAG: c-type cytochrome [Gemmatimonadota bacterium]|nr:c-type cytochrome [Gemmatimonadota bacterium]